MEPEVIPAILAKTREELLHRVARVEGLVSEIQIDVMDGEFVPNKTVGIEDLLQLPVLKQRGARYEFHWMVKDPQRWIERITGPHMHLVHVETIGREAMGEAGGSLDKIVQAVKQSGGRLGFAINPETPVENLLPYAKKAERVLVMTVRPGFSGQSYIYDMEHKVRKLRELFPKLDIEVDGGVNNETAGHAYKNGANILAAASAIFSSQDIKGAIALLKKQALTGCSHKPH